MLSRHGGYVSSMIIRLEIYYRTFLSTTLRSLRRVDLFGIDLPLYPILPHFKSVNGELGEVHENFFLLVAFSTRLWSDEIPFRGLKVTTLHFRCADLRQGWGGPFSGIPGATWWLVMRLPSLWWLGISERATPSKSDFCGASRPTCDAARSTQSA